MPDERTDIARLYARHREGLLVFLVRRTSDVEVALDLWAETFAQALASRGRYRGSTAEEEGAWLFKIASRQLSRYYRRGSAERRAMTRLGIERPKLNLEIESEIVRRAGLEEVRRSLADAVALLSDDAREAVTLRVLEELSYADVAARLAVSEQTARMRVSRGLRTLRDLIDLPTTMEALET